MPLRSERVSAASAGRAAASTSSGASRSGAPHVRRETRDAGRNRGYALQPARDGVRADVPTRESGCAVSDSATRLATTSMVCRVSGKTKRIFGASTSRGSKKKRGEEL